MKGLTKKFLTDYDSGDYKFNGLQYRNGAKITSHFGLEQGYTINSKGRFVWNSCRIHSGTDRSSRNSYGVNVVIAPFNFTRSEYIDYGKDHVYGAMLRLFNDVYGFEMRIVHMSPKDLSSDIKEKLLLGKAISKGTHLGHCGNYGKSDGKHTHTEFLSMDKTCIVFDEILFASHGNVVNNNYSNEEVIEFYKHQSFWRSSTDKEILDDWKSQIEKRRILYGMVNGYRYRYKDWYYGYDEKTRYSSELLFNGL